MTDGLESNPRAVSVIVCATLTVAIAATIVVLRLITRWKILKYLGKDDWCIAIALVSLDSPPPRPPPGSLSDRVNTRRIAFLHSK